LDRETKAHFDEAVVSHLKDADSVVIRALLPPIEGAKDTVTISDQRTVRGLVKMLKAARSHGPWIRMSDGVIISETSGPCQCWGEFEFQFFSGKKSLCTLSVHHWSHVRSELLTSGADIALEQKFMDQLYDVARDALPAFGARLKKPNSERSAAP
jgi:hypothetical protein